MNCLEPEDLPTFKKMAAVAIQEIDLQSARPNRTPRPGGLAYETKSHHTPESFRRDLESLLLLVSYEIQTCMYIYMRHIYTCTKVHVHLEDEVLMCPNKKNSTG